MPEAETVVVFTHRIPKREEKTMRKYVCDICGWVYDPAIGNPVTGVNPGTPFENLPDDFVCPECGAGKDSFSAE